MGDWGAVEKVGRRTARLPRPRCAQPRNDSDNSRLCHCEELVRAHARRVTKQSMPFFNNPTGTYFIAPFLFLSVPGACASSCPSRPSVVPGPTGEPGPGDLVRYQHLAIPNCTTIIRQASRLVKDWSRLCPPDPRHQTRRTFPPFSLRLARRQPAHDLPRTREEGRMERYAPARIRRPGKNGHAFLPSVVPLRLANETI